MTELSRFPCAIVTWLMMVVCFPIVRKQNFETMTVVSGDRYSILNHFMFDYYSGQQIPKRENESCYLERNES